MRKSHLNLLALTAGLLEGFRIGQGTDTISHIFVEVAGDFAIFLESRIAELLTIGRLKRFLA